MTDPTTDYHVGDCLWLLDTLPPASVDLVFCSPPYENRRGYGMDFNLKGEAWVAWAVERFQACLRVTKPHGLVCWVVNGYTHRFKWSAAPVLLAADLHRAGVCLRKPNVFHRVGIPGSGGPDWFRDDWEPVICATPKPGRLAWSDNTACGHPPKWGPGGEMSNRLSSGSRRNQWGHSGSSQCAERRPSGERNTAVRPSHVVMSRDQWGATKGSTGSRRETGERKTRLVDLARDPIAVPFPAISNPGNVIKCNVGGRQMGDPLCHENEAPFPELLAERFIRSFCPPGGTVLDCFAGSGTTLAVAKRWGRNGIGIDVRHSQIRLSRRRVERVVAGSGIAELEAQRAAEQGEQP